MSGCSFSWDDIKPKHSGLDCKQTKELEDAKHYLSSETVEAILHTQIGRNIVETAEKTCYKIDLSEIGKSMAGGMAVSGLAGKLKGFFTSSKGNIWKEAIDDGLKVALGEVVSQVGNIADCKRNKRVTLDELNRMRKDLEAKKGIVRVKTIKMIKEELEKHEKKAAKEVKEALKIKKEINDIRSQISGHSKTIGSLEGITERTLHPERYNGFVRKNGGVHPDQQFIYSREYRQHVYDNRTVYSTETYNRVCGEYDGDCGLGGNKSCGQNAPSWMSTDFDGLSGGSGSSGGSKNGCSIM